MTNGTTRSTAYDSLRVAGITATSATAAVAAAFMVLTLTATDDPVAMPTTPPVLTVIAAAVASSLVFISSRSQNGGLHVAVGIAGTMMLSGSLLALPHTVLMVIVRGVQLFTGGSGSFEVEPSWPSTIAHGLNAVAAAALARWMMLDHRRRRRRCVRCGRVSAAPPTKGSSRRMHLLAAVATTAALPYGTLKLAWGLGSDIGLTGDQFARVTLSSPGFGDTVALTGVAIVATVAMGSHITARTLRGALVLIGACASLMLVPVGATAAASLIPVALGRVSIDDSQIAPWAFVLVYASFLLWGVSLACLTHTYWRATIRRRRAHLAPSETERALLHDHTRTRPITQNGDISW